jgi:hypothetical protein
MEKETQISAMISLTTKRLLDEYVRASGVKKARLIEQALRHHLQAIDALPADVIVQPKLVVTAASGKAILRQIRRGSPTRALRDLMHED